MNPAELSRAVRDAQAALAGTPEADRLRQALKARDEAIRFRRAQGVSLGELARDFELSKTMIVKITADSD